MKIGKTFHFEAAHWLPGVPSPAHKCSRMHGHRYVFTLEFSGEVTPNGFLAGIDFIDLYTTVKSSVLDILDHQVLNDFIPNPTVENIAQWIADRIPAAYAVQVYETPDCWARVEK